MRSKICRLAGAVALALLGTGAAMAQEAAEGAATEPQMAGQAGPQSADTQMTGRGQVKSLDDVKVTARRRQERLQDVPVAVSAFTEAQIQKQGIRDSSDIARNTPSLSLQAGSFGSTSTNVNLRGIFSPGANISFDPTIGVYVDEVYLARNYGSLFDYFDVNNVQVLRGVQGTLFGRNNTGGAVLVNTVAPQMTNSLDVFLSAGNYSYFRGEVIGNLMLKPDVLAIRFGGMTVERDGYGRDVNHNKQMGDRDTQSYRASILLTPSEHSEFRLTHSLSELDDSGPIFSPRNPTGRVQRTGLGFYDVAYDSPGIRNWGHDESTTGSGRIDFGNLSAKLILNHLSGKETVIQDVDATDYSTPTLPNINLRRTTEHAQSSGEFQLSGKSLNDRLNWVTGIYALTEDGYQPTLNLGNLRQNRLSIDNRSKAIFAHGDLDVTDRFGIGAGIRYTKDEKSVTYGDFNTGTGVCIPPSAVIQAYPTYDPSTCRVKVSKDDGYFSWDLTANYKIAPDVQVYARTGRGQKSGGFNSLISNAADLEGYDPEVVTDYEIGIKSLLMGRRLKLNAAIFYTDYKDIQRTALVLVGTSPQVSISNAAQARIEGLELEAAYRFDSGFSINGNYSYTDPKFTEFTTRDAAGNPVDQSHLPFDFASKNQLGVTLGYDAYLDNKGQMSLSLGYYYRSEFHVYPTLNPAAKQDGYDTVNFRASFSPDRFPKMDIAVWGRNLNDAKYITGGSNPGAVSFVVPGQPRMYGVDFRYKFGGE
jgi:iron complex outermembrane receptor protein